MFIKSSIVNISVVLVANLKIAAVSGWSYDAHTKIGEIALSFLTEASIEHIGKLSLADRKYPFEARRWIPAMSSWADGDDGRAYDHDKNHFVHTSTDCKPYDATRDCPDGKCLVTAIRRHVEKFTSLDSTQTERTIALKFLIHYMGDIHQPLHVGFQRDRGGNSIKIPWKVVGKRDRTLHDLWDKVFDENWWVEPRGISVEDGSNFVKIFASVDFKESVSIENFAAAIASETSSRYTCPFAYKDDEGSLIVNGQILPFDKYIREAIIAAQRQVIRGGVRLGYLLNTLIGIYEQKLTSRESEETARRLDAVGKALSVDPELARLRVLALKSMEGAKQRAVGEASAAGPEDYETTLASLKVKALQALSAAKAGVTKKRIRGGETGAGEKLEEGLEEGLEESEVSQGPTQRRRSHTPDDE